MPIKPVKGSLIKAVRRSDWVDDGPDLERWETFIKTYEKGRVERGLLHDPPNSANKCCIREWEAGSCPSGGAHPFRNICKGVKKEVNGELPNPITLIFSYHSVIDHCWVGWWVTRQKASRKVKHLFYVLWNDQRSHLCYALHRVRVCLLSFLFFTSAPCALLRFIEERDRCLESEKQAQAIERIVPRTVRRVSRGG